MHLADLMSGDELISLEPEELGLQILRVAADWGPHNNLDLDQFLLAMRQGFSNPPSDFNDAVREAWAWLEGQALLISNPQFGATRLRILSRRARVLAKDPKRRQSSASWRLPKAALHPAIREDVWALYHRGKFESAVFEAMKAVEVAVRNAVDAHPCRDFVGVRLMRAAFAPEDGPLTDLSVDGGERSARADLFVGAIGSYKNPHSHRNVTLEDPDEAAEIIMLANALLRIVDSRAQPQ